MASDALQRFAERAKEARRAVLASLKAAPQERQRVLFEECIRANADTAFGKEHGFASLRDEADYKKAVPIRDYDAFAPWFKRAAAGERRVLTEEDPIAFNRTSGTTTDSKLLPWTPRAHQHHLRRRLATWAALLELHPEIGEGDATVLNLTWDPKPFDVSYTEGGVPFQNFSARTSQDYPETVGMPGTLAPWSRIPEAITDAMERTYYYKLRMTLEHDLRFVTCFLPSTIVMFGEQLDRMLPRLLSELRTGHVCGAPAKAPNPVRAQELERLKERHGTLLPSHAWPRLGAVSCWNVASCGLYLPRLRELFGAQVDILPYALTSSEGPITTFVDPHPTACLLATTGVSHEFIPEEVDLKPESETLSFAQLEVGGCYQIVLTQPAGLYRYSLGDVVKVVEFKGGVPRLEFVGRRGIFSSFTDEKLTERQVVDAAQAALTATALVSTNITCCPIWGQPPHYAFVVELERRLTQAQQEGLARELDAQLGHHNYRYPQKRKTGRIGPVQVHLVAPGTFLRFRERRRASARNQSELLKEKALHQEGPQVLEELLQLSGQGDGGG